MLFFDVQEISYKCPFIVYKKLYFCTLRTKDDEVENVA